MLRVERVSKSYGDVSALVDVSCEFIPGSLRAIIGTSGSGKSTLIRLLTRIESPDSGLVVYDKRQLWPSNTDISPPWPEVTCVFQHQFLWPHLTIRKNIELPLARLSTAERDKRFADVVGKFQMESFVDRYPNEVSGGQRQRGALARALALQPRVVLLDEAHSFLDIEHQANLNQLLLNLKRDGVALGVITHSVKFAREFCDYVYVLEGGRIVEEGPPNIFDKPQSRFLRSVAHHAL